jgi:hypothetical protein
MAFTADGLSNLEEVLERHVAKGSAPGLVALVAKEVETYVFSVGTTTLGGEMPVRRDTIFRIASMPVHMASREGRTAGTEALERPGSTIRRMA